MAISAHKRERIYKAYGNVCVTCGAKCGLTIDHIIPVSKGGKDHSNNLAPMCGKCNQKKGDKILPDNEVFVFRNRIYILRKKPKPVNTDATYSDFKQKVLSELKPQTITDTGRHLCYWEKYPLRQGQKVWEYEIENPECCSHRAIINPLQAYASEPIIVGLTKRKNGFNGFKTINAGNYIYQHKDYLYLEHISLQTGLKEQVRYNIEQLNNL